jgi:hypothetical protein
VTPGMIVGTWAGAWNPGEDGFCNHGDA